MNQSLLTRLFKSIEGDLDSPLIKVAFRIIEDKKQKGHKNLAAKLTAILNKNLTKKDNTFKPLKNTDKTFSIPVDRRYKLPLAKHIEHNKLRRQMVLSQEIEEKIVRIENEYTARERLAHHGLKSRKKILFYGSSGCGKSMAAERIAWDLGLPFYKIRFDTIISSYLGESASNLQSIFNTIENFPCVLLLDEFDIIGKQRDISSSDTGEIHRIVNILLGLLEEYDGEGIIIATTNLEGSLDQALFRRFDDLIEFPKPSQKEIEKVLKNSFSALPLNKNINLNSFSKKLIGMSYAIVTKIANDAAKKAVILSQTEITKDDLENAFKENKAINR